MHSTYISTHACLARWLVVCAQVARTMLSTPLRIEILPGMRSRLCSHKRMHHSLVKDIRTPSVYVCIYICMYVCTYTRGHVRNEYCRPRRAFFLLDDALSAPITNNDADKPQRRTLSFENRPVCRIKMSKCLVTNGARTACV